MTQTARCSAHGNPRCTWCSLNPANCGNPDATPDCHSYSVDGMHWDTCRNRIRGPEQGRTRLGMTAFPALGSRPLIACPKRQCRGFTPHSWARHYTPAWIGETYRTIRWVMRRRK